VKSYETVQVIGQSRAVVPRKVDIDLGWADIAIVNGKEIHFKSGGLRTDVGMRMPETTRGMSVMESRDVGESLPGTPASTGKVVNRPAMPKKKPKRKVRREDDFSDLTSLRGIKW
jgi:hypothetical protein